MLFLFLEKKKKILFDVGRLTVGIIAVFVVSQVCSEDGMEFTLRTPEGFLGRIYTHGYYDRCFYRGNGGTANVLRISGAQGYPDCGTQRVIYIYIYVSVIIF